jgi:hypothetical protein
MPITLNLQGSFFLGMASPMFFETY